jgi:hypothetical protein
VGHVFQKDERENTSTERGNEEATMRAMRKSGERAVEDGSV